MDDKSDAAKECNDGNQQVGREKVGESFAHSVIFFPRSGSQSILWYAEKANFSSQHASAPVILIGENRSRVFPGREASKRKDQFRCSGSGNAQREATEAAVNAEQTAIHSATNAAPQFVPDQTKVAQDALQTAKDCLAKGDYSAALYSAKEAAEKAKDALRAAKKEEWTNNWNSLSQSAPKTMSELQAKLDAYKKSGKLPKGVDPA